jgi:DMSO reductase anchor subunit
MLAAAAMGIIYLFSMMIISDLQQGESVNWWVSGTVFAVSLFTAILGSMLAKAELTDWR